MMDPTSILINICRHFGQHINAVHEAAVAEDEAALDALQERHRIFKSNVANFMPVQVTYVNSVLGIKAPTDPDTGMFSCSIMTESEDNEPIFPDFLGGQPHFYKAVVIYDAGVFTALYIKDGWEEEQDDDSIH